MNEYAMTDETTWQIHLNIHPITTRLEFFMKTFINDFILTCRTISYKFIYFFGDNFR